MSEQFNYNDITDTKTLGEALEQCDGKKSYFLTSVVPEMCKQQDCILGIDEAGRGPTLGPMVYSALYCVENKENKLSTAGCADSKSLSEANREEIFSKICSFNDYVGWEVEVISPKVISNSMLRKSKISLNEISHNAAINLVKRAQEAGVRVSKMFVDTVGPPEKYQAKLEAALPGIKVTVSKKADALYPVVSAASICAKVSRDISLKMFKCPEVNESVLSYGSGYPNDPVTKRFLIEILDPLFGFPEVVRFSWSTAEKIIQDKCYRVDWDDEETVDTPSVKSFFKSNEPKVKHKFFKDRHLTNTLSI